MRVTSLLVLSAVIGVATAQSLPLSTHACQCTSPCQRDMFYSYCTVDVSVCTDASERSSGKDKCGSMFDSVTSAFSTWSDWFSSGTQNLANKVESWSKENVQTIDPATIRTWAKAELSKIPTDKINEFTKEQIQALNVKAAMSLGKIGKMAEHWKDLSAAQWNELKGMSRTEWQKVVDQMPREEIVTLSNEVLAKLPVEEATALKNKVKALTLNDVATWTQTQWSKVEVDRLTEMSVETIQKIPFQTVGQWTQEQFQKIPVDKLIEVTGAQINKIDPSKLANMGSNFWNAVPVGQIAKLNIEVMQAAGFDIAANLDPEHIEYITTEKWRSVPIGTWLRMSAEQLRAVDYTALAELSAEKQRQIPIEKMFNLAGEQIQSINAQVAGAWTKEQWDKFPASKAVMFTGEQIKAGAAKLKELSAEQLAKFDLEALKQNVQLPDDVRAKLEAMDQAVKTKVQSLVEQAKQAKERVHNWRIKLEEAEASGNQPAVASAETQLKVQTVEYEALSADLVQLQASLDGVPVGVGSSAAKVVPALGVALLVAILMMST